MFEINETHKNLSTIHEYIHTNFIDIRLIGFRSHTKSELISFTEVRTLIDSALPRSANSCIRSRRIQRLTQLNTSLYTYTHHRELNGDKLRLRLADLFASLSDGTLMEVKLRMPLDAIG